LTPIVKKL